MLAIFRVSHAPWTGSVSKACTHLVAGASTPEEYARRLPSEGSSSAGLAKGV